MPDELLLVLLPVQTHLLEARCPPSLFGCAAYDFSADTGILATSLGDTAGNIVVLVVTGGGRCLVICSALLW